MSNANRDANRVTTILAVDYSDPTNEVNVTADPATGRMLTQSTIAGSLINVSFDTIQITSYSANDDPQIVLYKQGGTSGTLVATLTITYDGSNRITSVVRT
jgi:hypothetical protein